MRAFTNTQRFLLCLAPAGLALEDVRLNQSMLGNLYRNVHFLFLEFRAVAGLNLSRRVVPNKPGRSGVQET